MNIERLAVKNFKGFEEREFSFHPEFTLVVGMNGTGKTSLLDALAVAIGSWFLGIRDTNTRSIQPNEVMLRYFQQWETIYPCEITAYGTVSNEHISWTRSLHSSKGRTTYVNALTLKKMAMQADEAIRKGQLVTLPLISYYGTGRLWQEPRESFEVWAPMKISGKEEQSRLKGYHNSVDPRLSVKQLTAWIAWQSWIAYREEKRETPLLSVVRKALVSCIEDAHDLYFDAKQAEVIVDFAHGKQPFSNLSDGQRSMLAMVGDIALKAAQLNPHLGELALEDTDGVVLIDELDLHLHPLWQRRVIEDLRRTFPKIQFICTTHSPFLIQSLRSGDELLMLDGMPFAQLGNLSIDEIAQGIQRVENPEVSLHYAAMKSAAKSYLETLAEAKTAPAEKLEQFRQRLADQLSPYADNPAFQAFLEMKRIAALGE